MEAFRNKTGCLELQIMCQNGMASAWELLFQWASTIKIRFSLLVLYKPENYN